MSEENREKEFVELSEAAKRICVSPKILRSLIKKEAIGYYRPVPHGRYYFSDQHIESFRASRSFSPENASV